MQIFGQISQIQRKSGLLAFVLYVRYLKLKVSTILCKYLLFLTSSYIVLTVNLAKLGGKIYFYTKQLNSSYVKSNYILLVLIVELRSFAVLAEHRRF